MVNASDFNLLATRTANCLLGIDCGMTEDSRNSSFDKEVSPNKTLKLPNKDSEKNITQSLEDAVKRMAEEDKQQLMNKNSKGPYFLIFILFLLLLGFSLDKEED